MKVVLRKPHSIVQSVLKFMEILLPQLPMCWDYRYELLT